MSKIKFSSDLTRKKALQLIQDPTILFHLLYLKYGDIQDDINYSYANQIIYNEYTHTNITYKEILYNFPYEYLQKVFNDKDVRPQLSKLTACYKNYSSFFSKPEYTDFFYNKKISKYYERKAEYFYKNNYSHSKSSNTKSNHDNKSYANDGLSSLDNDTNNDIIFDKKIKKIIDNNLDSKDVTLTLNINTKNDLDYIRKTNISNSLANIVGNIVNYEKYKNDLKNRINEGRNMQNKINKKFITQLFMSKSKLNHKFKIDNLNKEEGDKTAKHKMKINKIILQKNSILYGKNNEIQNNNNSRKIKLLNLINKNKTNKISLNKQKEIYPLLKQQYQENKEQKPMMKVIFPKNKFQRNINLKVDKTPKVNLKNTNYLSPYKRNNKILTSRLKNSQIILNSSDIFDKKEFNSINYENSNEKLNQNKFRTLKVKYKSSIHDTNNGKLKFVNKKKFTVITPKNKQSQSTENIKFVDYLFVKDSKLMNNYKVNSRNVRLVSKINSNTKISTIDNEHFKYFTQRRSNKNVITRVNANKNNIHVNSKKIFYPIGFK